MYISNYSQSLESCHVFFTSYFTVHVYQYTDVSQLVKPTREKKKKTMNCMLNIAKEAVMLSSRFLSNNIDSSDTNKLEWISKIEKHV